MFAEILSIAGPILGGLMQSDSAESASQIQQQGQAEAIAEQRRASEAAMAELQRQYDTTRSDMAPWRNTGASAVYRLGDLLGLGGAGGSVAQGGAEASGPTLEQIVQELRSSGQFTTTSQAPAAQQMRGTPILMPNPSVEGGWDFWYEFPDGTINKNEYKPAAQSAPTIDEAALMAEAQRRFAAQQQRRFAAQQAQYQQAQQQAQQGLSTASSPFGPGALLQPFTGKDLQNEPGYQFGLTQGNKSIENAARARGMYYTPSTVKELLRYGTDYAGTKYNDAFNRDMSQKTSAYNMLSGVAGTGQIAANTVASAGQSMANNVAGIGMNTANTIGGLITSGANARGAAGIAGANAFGSGIGQGVQNYQQQQLMRQLPWSRFFPQMGGSPWSTPPFNPSPMSPSIGYGMIP